jgi:hypothetical protein
MTGAALVCQDLGHVEMLFPFGDRENVACCRPDLSDLRSTVESCCETRTYGGGSRAREGEATWPGPRGGASTFTTASSGTSGRC